MGAAHCNYICKDVDSTLLETCCCRDPDNNFASCRSTSSYCGTDGRLRLAAAEDLLLVCGEWSTAEEPELYSREEEVVLPVTKVINHPLYSAELGPGEGYDIAVYHADNTKLSQWDTVQEGVLYPACLPQKSDIAVGTRGIFAAWKDPIPLYVYYNFDFDTTVKNYRANELIMHHTRMDIVKCKDPDWMGSDTFYPRGVFCARDPSCESCLDTGDSGSGLVMGLGRQAYSWVGTLSFTRGCNRALSGPARSQNGVFSGENPGVFSEGLCYLPWIARQYGLGYSGPEGEDCHSTSGTREDKDKTDCTMFSGQKCDFDCKFHIHSLLTLDNLPVQDT